jgi:hypothetical protein
MLGDEGGLSPVRDEFGNEPLGRFDENHPLGGEMGMDFDNQNNMYGNDHNPLRDDYGQF